MQLLTSLISSSSADYYALNALLANVASTWVLANDGSAHHHETYTAGHNHETYTAGHQHETENVYILFYDLLKRCISYFHNIELVINAWNTQRKCCQQTCLQYITSFDDAIVCSMQDFTILMREINTGPGEVYGCITAHIRANFILWTPRGLISLASMIATCTFIEVTPEYCSGHFIWHCILQHILNSLYLVFSILDFQPRAKKVILKLRIPVGCM